MDELLDLSTQFFLLNKSPKSNDVNKNLQSRKKKRKWKSVYSWFEG